MKVIGIVGYARSGKDTFASIAKEILTKKGYKVKQYSFAEQLKKEVANFLRKNCGVDVWSQNSDVKKDIRDFLVWYGTTFWRKRDPERWIRGVDNQLKLDGNEIDIAIVSDVRYPNEGEWVNSWNGYLVHVAAWKMVPADKGCELGGHDWAEIKTFLSAPNEQERINDPLVKAMAQYHLEWPVKGLSPQEAVEDKELRNEVSISLNSVEFG